MITIIRGPSSSGKSYLANKITGGGKDCPVVEADDYFLVGTEFPQYKFEQSLLHNAHSWCRLEAERLLRRYGSVCVANTFTQKWEWAPYLDLAVKYATQVRILEPSTTWMFDLDELVRKNQHNVPREVIEKQLARWTVLEDKEKFYDFSK